MNRSCLDGFLTSSCRSCEFWRDGNNPNKELGCAVPFPISHCEAFAEMEKETDNSIPWKCNNAK